MNVKTRELGAITIAGISLLGIAALAAMHGEHEATINETGPKLPTAADARHVLSTTSRHIEWVAAPLGPPAGPAT